MDKTLDASTGGRLLKIWFARRVARRIAAGFALLLATSSWAATVTYMATDLADTLVGQDLWQYTYVINGPLASFNSANVLFAPANFADLNLVSNSDPGSLDVVNTQPDPFLPADGQSTMLALVDLSGSFSALIDVSFVWLGAGAPGSQPFQILDDQFNLIAEGRTTPTDAPPPRVPEPNGMLLTLTALGLAARLRR